ncbi:MAG: metallophosphoesterase family protein [Candidatus Dojkabacteria bacterium]|jgi:Icc-related predicted phosphoesterase
MKILAIADRPPREGISKLLSENLIELILTLGDLDYMSLRELEDIQNIPKLGVYGNHCSGQYFEPLGITNLHLRIVEYGGLTFGGFEGSIRYKESEYAKMYTQEEASLLLKDFPHVDVMISHSPPFGINDEPDSDSHQGFKALREYIQLKNPKYFLHGHTYPTKETLQDRFENTSIVYIYQDCILEL